MEATKKLDTIDATPMLSPIELSCLRKKAGDKFKDKMVQKIMRFGTVTLERVIALYV